MNNIEILEELSDNEHSRWANWQKYVHSKCIKNKDGSLTIPKEYVDHWNYEINTEYKDLPENIKESDRKEVRKILETLNYKNLIKENKELKEKNNNWEKFFLKYYDDIKNEFKGLLTHKFIDYIPKSKVKEKIEEMKRYRDYRPVINKFTYSEIIDYEIKILQELLEEGE